MVTILGGREALWLDIGTIGFEAASRLQLALSARRREGEIPDVALVMEHDPCVTLGRGAKAEHVLAGAEELSAAGIEVYHADRGGDVTYHGWGQLVCWPIVDLRAYDRDVHAHARRLEEIMIRTAASFGVSAYRDSAYPGVWCSGGKLGAVGFSVRRWVTTHGAGLNVNPHMPHYDLIVACGIHDRSVTSLERELGRAVGMDRARSELRSAFAAVFEVGLRDAGRDEVDYVSGLRSVRGRRHEMTPAGERGV
ncbi:MAG: lipoyl(octanoyl) transferase LipB [Thermoleophilia bacterium]